MPRLAWLRTLPMKTAAVVQQDQNRADYMEYLYELYDRGNPASENCFTYTGLYLQHSEKVGADAAALQVDMFHIGLIEVVEDDDAPAADA